MDFSEAAGFDADSIALHDRICAIASSENCDYAEATTRLFNRLGIGKTPANTAKGFDPASLQLAEKIQRQADLDEISFTESFDRLYAEGKIS